MVFFFSLQIIEIVFGSVLFIALPCVFVACLSIPEQEELFLNLGWHKDPCLTYHFECCRITSELHTEVLLMSSVSFDQK